ncbi:MAG: hypothetical protein QNK37_03585, partial [Acidobacteriota bacterium]|nr:hypothetical protein [Acidobacteriota bacterium]
QKLSQQLHGGLKGLWMLGDNFNEMLLPGDELLDLGFVPIGKMILPRLRGPSPQGPQGSVCTRSFSNSH